METLRSFGYICPQCGKAQIHQRSRFVLSAAAARMECECEKAALQVEIREEIRCSPHTARHYFAQTHLRNGLDVYSVSRLLGHENINITKRYLQSLQDSSIVEMAVKTSPLRNLKL